jgi:hypothetical protein
MDGVFVESTLFSRLLPEYLTEEEYRDVQNSLLDNPEAGVLIKGSGGLRKLRMRIRDRGERGGLRLVYYWHKPINKFYMVNLYDKSETSNLSRHEIMAFRLLVKDWIEE